MIICKNCGETMIGDGYNTVIHCPNHEPDAATVNCGYGELATDTSLTELVTLIAAHDNTAALYNQTHVVKIPRSATEFQVAALISSNNNDGMRLMVLLEDTAVVYVCYANSWYLVGESE